MHLSIRIGYNFNPSNNINLDQNSNGSGKSTLAMSALWALTGSLDTRPVNDAKVSDVVHDNSLVSLQYW